MERLKSFINLPNIEVTTRDIHQHISFEKIDKLW
jgi:hypothetical protein